MDSHARRSLWEDGLDYEHGTGHGVGAFLNVHEGPHGISKQARPYTGGIVPGMIVSNEPGYYEDGGFGIRIENLVVARESNTRHTFRGQKFVEFETITYVPIQRKLIAKELLTSKEIDWLNSYHKLCYRVVHPLIAPSNIKALEWLERETMEL
jgi:Xaa-Pro aminopeptidase